MKPDSARLARPAASTVGLLLALGAVLGWLLLDPWRPLPIPGPEEAAALEGGAGALAGEAPAALAGTGAAEQRRSLVPEGGAAVQVLDAATHRPLPRAELLLGGSPPRLLGRTGPDGRIALPEGTDPARLLVRKGGYLGLLLGLETPLCRRLRGAAASGGARLALAPDPVTRALAGRVTGPGEAPEAAAVALRCLEPADPERPQGLPPALQPAWRVALAVERICVGAECEAPWELGRWSAESVARAGCGGRFAFRTLSSGPAVLRAATPSGLVARRPVRLPAAAEIELALAPGSWLRPLAPGAGRIRAHCGEGWSEEGGHGGRLGPFLPGEPVRLQARWPGGEETEATAAAPAAGVSAEVLLPAPGAGRGWAARTVATGSGAPLAGVAVRVLGGAATLSDAEGRFFVELGGTAGSVGVLFEGPAVERRRLALERSGPLPEVVALLPAGLEAQAAAGLLVAAGGRVQDASGRAAAGALVAARCLDPPSAEEPRPRGIAEGRTDSEGRFRLLLPAPGRYTLEAVHLEAGRAALEVGLARGAAVPALLLVLEPAARLEGRVLDRGSGAPLAAVLVICTRPGQPTLQARTDAHGRFAVVLPASGAWSIEARTGVGAEGRLEAQCFPGGTLQVELRL